MSAGEVTAMNRRCADLLAILRAPERMTGLSLAAWDRLLPQAAAAGLLARLAVLAEDLGLTDALPPPVRPHLRAALTLAARQRRAVAWEARQLDAALAATGMPVLLLKGAAYVLGELPPARGRLFADIDILVPKAQLGLAEAQLMLHGWHATQHSDYDQRYYRQWMHELPPMTHIRRQSHLDVHHDLLPETARRKTQPERVIEAAQPLAGYRCLHLPCLEDLVLHSATHLFHEGEWGHALRDLTDLDALLRLGLQREGWWRDLLGRARQLDLDYPLALALRYARRLLATPVPQEVLAEAARTSNRLAWPLRDALFLRGFSAAHADCGLPGTAFAAFLLYVRAHWLRMPLHLLLPHLLYKATRRAERSDG
jgi:hypothetical protein